ncbi:MAG TPA: adenylate/guanylate cyclase domain-containing protein [Candidatus Marinimicrobia bacterium]|nr:adenylate/guanylate cyclase domain-containing protein [Candidatus Neomarinimicrobiota bacterium]
MKINTLKQAIGGIIIALVLALLVSIFLVFGIFREMELKSLDARFKNRGPKDISHSKLIIVAIDDQTFKSCRERYPYPREYYATLIENLEEVGIKTIMFDIQFTEPDYKNPLGDSILADAIRKNGNVILAGKVTREFSVGGVNVYADKPLPILLETGSDWGVVGEIQDPDGFTRRYPIFEQYQDKTIYTLGTKVFFKETGLPRVPEYKFENGYFIFTDSTTGNTQRLLAHRGSLGWEQTILINYYGPAGTFPTYSMSAIIDDSDFDLKDEEDTDYLEMFKRNSTYPLEMRIALIADSTRQFEAIAALAGGDTASVLAILDEINPFKGKIALVGVSIEELHDNKFTPFYNYGADRRLMPGVETHAHAIQTMLDQSFIRSLPITLNIILIFVISILTAVAVAFARPVLGGVLALILGFGALVLSYWTFRAHAVWVQLVPLLVATGTSYLSSVVYQFLFEQKEKRKIRSMFQTYMSPKILKYLEDHPDAFSLSGEKREATMFFSDVANFTTISESLSAEELALVLNKYLSPMTEILMKYDGYVDKYEGDAIMCDFGVPMEDTDHAWKACFAAIDQQAALEVLRPQIKKDHGVDIFVRMGINSGVVSAGNMGSNQRFQYTVMGDAVNQASRFEGANKQYGTYIMIGEETYHRAQDKIEVRILDRLVVKGKLKPITVYELLGRKGQVDQEMLQICAYFTEGINLYWNRQWDAAIAAFEKAIAVKGEDKPSHVFIERCHIYKNNPPGPNWQGEFVMETK